MAQWATVITKVTWTSPEPRGVGATRIVDMRGGIVGDEEFLAWEPFTRMAFRFNNCSTPAVAAFAEDYRVEAMPGGCRLTWTMAQKPAGFARLAMFVGRPLLNRMLRRFLANLRTYTDRRFGAAPVSPRKTPALTASREQMQRRARHDLQRGYADRHQDHLDIGRLRWANDRDRRWPRRAGDRRGGDAARRRSRQRVEPAAGQHLREHRARFRLGQVPDRCRRQQIRAVPRGGHRQLRRRGLEAAASRLHPPACAAVQRRGGHRLRAATSEVGPFYCPVDQTAYFDTDFFQVLKDQFGSSGGPLAQEYVVAHEFGHHVQDLAGSWVAPSRARKAPAATACARSCKPTAMPACGRITRRRSVRKAPGCRSCSR
ncbi:neutral zinc metallopeptidase family protein [Mycobacterium xenopi 4042]|uniref:Neutral zinc metallopeptidase family protein n=1 Tax=Mycobacterium xenopi 4042 TaxID=1299334 RepID=X8AL82_MYCXE|nr:neutral zinc metallopeptidase family protein [Mycobacterium xenopi 4042]